MAAQSINITAQVTVLANPLCFLSLELFGIELIIDEVHI